MTPQKYPHPPTDLKPLCPSKRPANFFYYINIPHLWGLSFIKNVFLNFKLNIPLLAKKKVQILLLNN